MSDTPDSAIARLTEASLLDEARATAGLNDFGDLWFLEPMNRLLVSIREEA